MYEKTVMVDRLFAGVLLIATPGYAVIAVTAIRAPFQYDPLGSESWPQILSLVAIACLLMILWKPDAAEIGVAKRTGFRLAATVAMPTAFSELYEPLGFVLSTILFGTALCTMLGGGVVRALAFGVAAGVAGHLLCAVVLDLNLPEGALIERLTEPSVEEGASRWTPCFPASRRASASRSIRSTCSWCSRAAARARGSRSPA